MVSIIGLVDKRPQKENPSSISNFELTWALNSAIHRWNNLSRIQQLYYKTKGQYLELEQIKSKSIHINNTAEAKDLTRKANGLFK